jgi:hypothetical protein
MQWTNNKHGRIVKFAARKETNGSSVLDGTQTQFAL